MVEKHSGLIVKSRMNEIGMTQKKLAEQIGSSHARLSQWMNGHEIPSDRIIRKVAEKLDLDFEKLRLEAEKERFQKDRQQLYRKYAEVVESPGK